MQAFQLRSAALALVYALAMSPTAGAAPDQPIGYVDSLTAQHAVGWSCLRDSAGPVSIAVYAGTTLLGVYPANTSRSDVASVCGGTVAHGFAVGFDAATQAQLVGQSSLSVQASAGGLSVLLPVSTSRTENPFTLPAGSLWGLDATGMVDGSVTEGQAEAPRIAIFAGGPLGQGGVPFGTGPSALAAPSIYDFAVSGSLPASAAAAAPGAAVPLYGYADDGTGAMVPLAAPIALKAAGQSDATVSLDVTVVQGGSHSGITSTLYTAWLPAGSAFTTLTGNVSLAGNDPSFAEALVLLGVTGDAQAACLARNGTWPSTVPAILRLWAVILKNTGAASGTVPVNFALPNGVALRGAGSGLCLATLVSAGYPYLDRTSAKYTRTTVNLTAGFQAVSPSFLSVAPVGLGGEFKFDTAAGPGATTYVGIKAIRRLAVDGIAGSVSASAVAGAPAGSGWQPAPPAFWGVATSFVVLPAPSCQTAGFLMQPSNGNFSVLRRAVPVPFTLPAGARTVASFPLAGSDTRAVQRSAFAGTPALTLDPGDCLVALQHLTSPATLQHGLVDYENQSTAYLHQRP